MDREIWRVVMKATREINRCLPKAKRRFQYSECLILRMYLWTVWHDRPLCWACDRAHYNTLFRPRQLPSISQFSRRVGSTRFRRLLKVLYRRLTREDHHCMVVAFFDGKALPVNECSKDPDAKTGRGSGRFSRGYKLHALVDDGGKVCDYRVRPLNEGEQPIAEKLSVSLRPGTCVYGDGNLDSGGLYEAVRRRGAQLLTPLRQVPRSPHAIAQMPPGRRAALEAWHLDPEACEHLYCRRGTVERTFGRLTSFAGGLGPLPPWVRRLKRVERWVGAKICIYHARLEALWTLAA